MFKSVLAVANLPMDHHYLGFLGEQAVSTATLKPPRQPHPMTIEGGLTLDTLIRPESDRSDPALLGLGAPTLASRTTSPGDDAGSSEERLNTTPKPSKKAYGVTFDPSGTAGPEDVSEDPIERDMPPLMFCPL